MTKIRILPEILSNKIAAGEVVERPASVVKELIENALDANSTRVIIEVERGGRSLIRVSDNGNGMSRDDALLALERYATSKIYEDADLFSIKTLGFRGEALPSIASVSRFSMETRDEASPVGTGIVVEGGKIKKVSEVGAPVGTMITVKQLFFNTPARRKFLKTINTEVGHIADIAASIALGWPKVQFRIHHNGKIVKSWSSVSDPAARVADVLDSDLMNAMNRMEFGDDCFSVSGWISSPRAVRSTSRKIYTYINGRFIRDRVIQHALFEGYTGKLMKGQYPVAVLDIKVPFDRVDVNVHPTKHTVRFSDQRKVHDAIRDAVARTLQLADHRKWAIPEPPNQQKTAVSELVASYTGSEARIPLRVEKTAEMKIKDIPAKQADLWDKKRFGDLRIIGQLHNTYILCESDEGLVLVDQHAAHERILFERLKNRSTIPVKASQNLLIPETIDLGYREADILEKIIADLKEVGLEIEPFGGNTFVVKSVPGLLSNREIKPLIIEIVEKMIAFDFAPGIEGAIDQCLILMACHGAIRAHQHLSDQQIRELLKQLDECENPSNCPHGRPTWIRWSARFLEKSFSRIT